MYCLCYVNDDVKYVMLYALLYPTVQHCILPPWCGAVVNSFKPGVPFMGHRQTE